MSENIIKMQKRDRRLWLLLPLAILGILLLIWGSIGGEQGQEKAESDRSLPDPESYARSVETQVEGLCSRVKGAGSVSVAVTLKGGYRSVYATDSQSTSSGYKNSTVLTGSGSSEEAILVCFENPEIAGIGIVCTGGGDPAVRENIVSLVAATYNLGSNKIFVAPARQS